MEIVYTLVPVWLIALFCWGIAAANLYLSCRRNVKRLPKRLKAGNWLFLGGVYGYMALGDFVLEEVRVLIRLSIAFLILGEAFYHTDTFQDMADDVVVLVKRWTHG